MHHEFARAGAELLQAMSWGVRPFGREKELHKVAVELAREAAGPDRYVAGTISQFIYSGSSKWEPLECRRSQDGRRSSSRDGSPSRWIPRWTSFIVETFYSVEEASIAIPFVKEAGVPAVVTLTFRDSEFTRDGYDPVEAAKRLVDNGADVVGLNCMRPWQTMNEMARKHPSGGLRAHMRPADGVSIGTRRGLQSGDQPRQPLPQCRAPRAEPLRHGRVRQRGSRASASNSSARAAAHCPTTSAPWRKPSASRLACRMPSAGTR